jgi:hypothetical protein
MKIFVFLIVMSFSFFIYYKTKYFRTKLPMQRAYLSGKSSISLGVFVALFGLNQLFLFHTTVTYIVAAIFILVGGWSIYGGVRMYKYYAPLAEEEYQAALK